MPLSEHEQRLLDQIERALTAEDPKFASTVRSSDLRSHHRRRLRGAALLLLVGLLILVVGAVSSQPVLGVLGFLVMLGAGMRAASVGRTMTGHAPATRKPQVRGSFGSRSEERMRRRIEGDGR